MKRLLIGLVICIGFVTLSNPTKAQAASCFSNTPDSAWGSQNPVGNYGQPESVLKELRGPNGTGNQTLIIKRVEIVSNSDVVKTFVDINVNNPEPSAVDDILRGKLTLYTLKSDYRTSNVDVNVRYVYSGLNCDERIVSIPGSIKIEYKFKSIPYTDQKAIVNALLTAYPAYNFASAQADYDERFLPFFNQYVNSESNPLRITNANFSLSSRVFTYFGPGGNAGSGYYVVSNDGCVTGDIQIDKSNNYFNGINYGYTTFPIPFPKYFWKSYNSSGNSIVSTLKFNQPKCRLQIILALNAPTSNFRLAAGPYYVPPEAPTFIEGYIWVEDGLRDAELKAAADAKVLADKAAAELKAKQEAEAKFAADKAAADKAAAKKITITCIKGKITKKIISSNPKCPTGYKKK